MNIGDAVIFYIDEQPRTQSGGPWIPSGMLGLATAEPRQPGFYWVLYMGSWWVACWALGCFHMPGSDLPLYEHEMQEVGEQVKRG